eukprot:15334301-Heterocapsa_arctica.AAC.1
MQDVGRDPAAAGPAAALARQVVYLYGSLVTRTTMQWQYAGAVLIRACEPQHHETPRGHPPAPRHR